MIGDPNNVTLTESMALKSSKAQNIEEVTKLYFYHENISDIAICEYMPKLEIAYFTSNKIKTLKPFAKLHNLRELYIRHNFIATFDEIKYLQELKNLRILWMLNNPIAEQPSYRELIIKMLPQLDKLDDVEISDAERRFVALANPEVHRQAVEKNNLLVNVPKSFPEENNIERPSPTKKATNTLSTSQPSRSSLAKSGKNALLSTGNKSFLSSSVKKNSLSQKIPEPEEEDDQNLLTAVLSLLPELSYESLEIVLHKIRELTK